MSDYFQKPRDRSLIFRYPLLIQVVVDILVPLFDHTPDILTIPCSRGEDPLSIQLYAEEQEKDINISGSDISRTKIMEANKGRFKEWRSDLETMVSDGYSFDRTKLVIDRNIINKITFFTHDLLKGPTTQKYDIIYCTHLLEYFTAECRYQAIRNLHGSLRAHGFLVIDPYEYPILPYSTDKENDYYIEYHNTIEDLRPLFMRLPIFRPEFSKVPVYDQDAHQHMEDDQQLQDSIQMATFRSSIRAYQKISPQP